MTVLDDLVALKAYENYSAQEFVYVKGYSLPGDGAEGFFRFAPGFPETADMMYVKPDDINPGNNGRWVREDYQFLNVKFFGAKGGNGTIDDTDAIQSAIDFAANKSFESRTIYFPNGTYLTDKIIIRSKTMIQGELGGTILKASNSADSFFVEIDEGAISNVIVENLTLDGNNTSKICLQLEAKPPPKDPDGNGGIGNSRFSNITIQNFNNHGINLVGGQGAEYEFNLPNSFLSFENVRVNRNNVQGAYGLFIKGQNGQINFLNCSFSGKAGTQEEPLAAWNVRMEGATDNGRPEVIKFNTCGIQNAVGGIYMTYSKDVEITNCYFEELDTAIQVLGQSRVVNIKGNRLEDATDYGQGGSGYLLDVNNQSYVTFKKNVIVGTYNSGNSIFSSGLSTVVRHNNYPTDLNN